jgi:DNA-binding SARP family transcriptional activator
MQFGVLGPLSVTDAGREIGPERGRQRTLLAVLLVHANETVSVDRLVDALWATPPASAMHAIEVHVSELRRRLAADGGPRILTRPRGYSLRVERGELDATRFEETCREGREAATRGDGAAAVEAFLAAEALWRGSAFGELAEEPFARAEAVRLDGLRVAARGERLDAQLAAGRHHAVIGELEALTLGEPWHEGAHAQLMLALYRDGRQADALAVYRRLRSTLVDDLGIEPGPAVEGLQLAILRHDPAIAAPTLDVEERVQGRHPATPASAARAAAPTRAVEPESERRLVTALLVDLVDAADLSRRPARDPEHVRRAQQRLIEAVEAVALLAGAVVVAMMDGGAMAIFGAEVAREDHADLALGAALTLLPRLMPGSATPGAPLPAIVVDSGEVLVEPGVPGAAGIIGGPVGDLLALRDAAAGGEIRVGSRAAAAARSAFAFGDAFEVNTRARPVVGRCLLGPGPAGAELAGSSRPLIGRGRESGELDRAWTAVRTERSPRLTLVMGDPGIGKSALVRSWTGAVEAAGVAVTRGRCLAYGQGITYWPMAEILRDRLGLDDRLADTEVLERLGDRRILGLTLGLDPFPGLHPMAAQRQLHAAWVDLLASEVAAGPLVLVLEDLHWAEAPLVELVGTLARQVPGPLFIVATARPEFAAQAGTIESGRHVAVIWLEPLSDEDARTLASERLGSAPSAGIGEILGRAEGNPFYIEELFASLIDRGTLTTDGERWTLAPAAGAVLPDSVRSVLESRLELLDPDSRHTLQVASVIGRRFDLGSVEALLGGSRLRLDELVRREFIRPLPDATRDGALRYAFKHALTRDAAYETLTLARRAKLHAALAEHLERPGDQGTADHAAFVAHHYLEAVTADGAQLAWEDEPERLTGLEAKARRWAMEAARTAKARYAIDDSVSLLDRALACHPDPLEASALWLEIGRANVLRYDGVGFWSAMDAAIELAGSDAERAAIYAELAFETAFRWAIWTRMPERELVDGWIDRALELAPPDSRALAYSLVARAYWHPLEAGDAPHRAIAIAERLDDPVVLSYALDAHALTAFVAGDDRAAFERWERRTALAPRISDLDHLEDLYGAAIAGNAALGRFAEARRYADLHDGVAMQLSSHHQLHAVAMHLELEELAGGWARMLSLSDRAEQAVAANLATPCVRNQRSLLACALAAARLGDEAASRRLEAAAEALGMQGYEAVFDPVRVRIAVARGEIGGIRARLPLRMPPPSKNWWRLTTMIARLEAGLATGDRDTVVQEARLLLVDGTLLEAFAARALAAVRADPALASLAAERFDRLGIDGEAALLA